MAREHGERQYRKRKRLKQCFYHRFGMCPYGDSCKYYHKPREVTRSDSGSNITVTTTVSPKRTRKKGHCFCGAKTMTIPISRPLMIVNGGLLEDDGNRRQCFCCVCSKTGRSIHKC